MILSSLLFILLVTSSQGADQYRVDCEPDKGSGELDCIGRSKCSWEAVLIKNPQNLPECVRAKESAYYTDLQGHPNIQLKFNGLDNSFDTGNKLLAQNWTYMGNTLQVTINAPDSFSPPIEIPRAKSHSTESLEYVSTIIEKTNQYAFQVKRQSTGTVLWDTGIGGFFYAPQFLEISTYLPSKHVFGLGEHVSTKLKHDTTVYTDFPMLATGNTPNLKKPNTNLYGVHPFYICVENDGKAHGVLILNSSPQEIVIGPLLTYRSIGGNFEIVFFPGPTPEEVIQQYHIYIGTPALPPYWSLGYQFGRRGLKNIDDLQLSINKFIFNQLPLDVVHLDDEIQNDHVTFSLNSNFKDVNNFIDGIHANNMKVAIELDATIGVESQAFAQATASDVSFVSWSTEATVPKVNSKYANSKGTQIMLAGSSSSLPVGFLDFLDPFGKTDTFWTTQLQNYRTQVNFDGITLNRNEPVTVGKTLECPSKNSLDNPPFKLGVYSSKECLCEDSLCMQAKTYRNFYNFYDTRNLYGLSQTKSTAKSLTTITGSRPFVVSRSTFVSSGRYGGHWLDGKQATWDDLKTAITGALQFNWFGIPLVGSDICGSTGKATEELCLRWHQLAAFHPLSRNMHDSSEDTEPATWVSVTQATLASFQFKYSYAPYLYSLFARASDMGGTVIRPLFFEYPNDIQALDIDYQFMWGSALMVSPVTEQGVTSVRTYFPQDTWYSLTKTSYGKKMGTVYFQVVHAPLEAAPPVFLRAGHIIPRQQPNTTLMTSHKNPLELLFGMVPNFQGSEGFLVYDKGDDVIDGKHTSHNWNFKFNYTNTNSELVGYCIQCDPSVDIPYLNVIEVLGYAYQPDFTSFRLNNNKINVNVQTSSYSPISQHLLISTNNFISLTSMTSSGFSLTWNHNAI